MTAEVIKGPWPKSKIPKHDSPEESVAKQARDLNIADEITETVVVQMIHHLGENGFDVQEKDFVRDMGFLIECVKGIIYRYMGYNHPLQGMMNNIVSVDEILTEDQKQQFETSFNVDALDNINDFIRVILKNNESDDDPDLA